MTKRLGASRSLAAEEIAEAPEAVRRALADSAAIARVAGALERLAPPAIATIARGSSDHAATFFKYVCELSLGIPVASLGPSIASVYHAPLRMKGLATLAISQSGRSPDLIELQAAARDAGALTVAAVNDAASPLANASELVLDLRAGPERSVAATKSFIASLAMCLDLISVWTKDRRLATALGQVADHVEKALACDWANALETFAQARSLFVIGRGPGLAVAGEAALKLKEMCGVHAEAYSAAEIYHGPVTLVDDSFLVLALAAGEENEAELARIVDELAAEGVPSFITSTRASRATVLPVVRTGHPFTDHLAVIASFYVFAEALARRRGRDPDRPVRLKKVTQTR